MIKFGIVTPGSVLIGGQPRPRPRGEAPTSPSVSGPPTYAELALPIQRRQLVW